MLQALSHTRITLALDILGKLNDGPYAGYHELNSIKHRVDLCDTISIRESSVMKIECNDPDVPCNEENICWKVVSIVKGHYGIKGNVTIALDKRIPVKGGLAGGSANGATVLGLLNELWGLKMNREQKMALGRSVGMDIPYYFSGGTAVDSETRSFPRPVETSLSFAFVLAIPEFGVPTKEAYAGIDYSRIGHRCHETEMMEKAFLTNDKTGVAGAVHNDFEFSVFQRYPRLADIKKELLAQGCSGAVLSGSGSTILGIARDFSHASDIQKSMNCRTLVASTLRMDASPEPGKGT